MMGEIRPLDANGHQNQVNCVNRHGTDRQFCTACINKPLGVCEIDD